MTAVAWLAQKLGRVCQVLGGMGVLALGAGTLLYVFAGERRFPTVFADGPAPFGTFVWRTAAWIVATYVVWRILFAFVRRFGSIETALRMADLDGSGDYSSAQPSLPLTHCCALCGERFPSWDAAYDHAEDEHGRDRLPEELQSLIMDDRAKGPA